MAANLNFPQLLSGPLFVARSGKTNDFRSSSLTKPTPLANGLVACDAVCDWALAEGASGTPDCSCCATLTSHAKQQLAAIKHRPRLENPRLIAITRDLQVIYRKFTFRDIDHSTKDIFSR
ncbi:MAG: hypothetical protein WA815_03875 [Terracidiphilus sp.]